MNPDAGVLRAGERAVIRDRRTASLLRSKILHSGRRGRRRAWELRWSVFTNSRSCVVHPDDDQRGDRARLNAKIRGLPDVPVLPWMKEVGAIKQILAVMKIRGPGNGARTGERIRAACKR